MSLWTELKRRNIFRVAAAYVVIGWLSLQVADIILGMVGAPDWVGKSLIALLILGFVPVLALAWVFEVGPEGIRVDDGSVRRDAGPQARRLDVVTLGAVVLVMILMVWQHLSPALIDGSTGEQNAAAPSTESDPGTPESRPSLESMDRQRLEALMHAVIRATPGWSERKRETAAAVLDMLWQPPLFDRLTLVWGFDADRAAGVVKWLATLIEEAIRHDRIPESLA